MYTQTTATHNVGWRGPNTPGAGTTPQAARRLAQVAVANQLFSQYQNMGNPQHVSVCYGGMVLWGPETTWQNKAKTYADGYSTIAHITQQLVDDYYELETMGGTYGPSTQQLAYVRPQGFHLIAG